MAVTLTYNVDAFRRRVREASAEGIKSAATHYHSQCRRAVSIPNTLTKVKNKNHERTARKIAELRREKRESWENRMQFQPKSVKEQLKGQRDRRRREIGEKIKALQRTKKKLGQRGSRMEYVNSSKPGEPPRLRTGFGQRNIVITFLEINGQPAARVGVVQNAIYMFYLEIGTARVKRRPWMLSTLMANKEALAALAAAKWK